MMNEELVSRASAEENVLIMAERLAMLYQHITQTLISELGEAEAARLVDLAIAAYGEACGQQARQKVLEQGKEASLANHHLSRELPQFGWRGADLATEAAGEQLHRTDFCPFAKTWQEADFAAWGRRYCYVDQAKYAAYRPGTSCVHEKNLLDGDDCCLMRLREV